LKLKTISKTYAEFVVALTSLGLHCVKAMDACLVANEEKFLDHNTTRYMFFYANFYVHL